MNCQFLKPDKSRCGAFAAGSGMFCYFHDPSVPETEKNAARARGGLGQHTQAIKDPLPNVNLNNAKDAMDLFGRTINEVRSGLIDVRTANCIGFLAGHFIRAIEAVELEEKLTKIEDQLNRQPTPGN
jgi:hypothetical protein